ncbi:hypothetical protein DyAD56_16190 [Dyella sp. AD56]|nr:hypothetical protein DyAD56_16190 [Dyella sp. AD56]
MLGIIVVATFLLAAGAAMFASDDNKQQQAAQPTNSEPVTHAAPFTVRRVVLTGAVSGSPMIEVSVTETTGTEANRAATVKAIAERVMKATPQADSVFVRLIRSDLPAGGDEVLHGRIAHADYTPGGKNAAQPWTVAHSTDTQIVSMHDFAIGDAFGDLQEKMEQAAGQNADVDVVDEQVRQAIIRKYKLPATWKQQDVPLANPDTSDGSGPANIDASAAEASLKVIDACVKNGGCDGAQAKTFAGISAAGGEPLVAGSPMQASAQTVGCPNIHSLDIAMKAIRSNDGDSAMQALASEVQSGTCSLIPAGARVKFQHFGGRNDDLAQIRLADGTVVWTLGAVLVGSN